MLTQLFVSRKTGLWLIAGVYVLATVVGFVAYHLVDPAQHLLWKLFWADFAATVFVWLGSVLFRNSSVYDPYWSVAPVVLLTILAIEIKEISLPGILLLVAVWVWGTRLTVNWAITFRNLSIQDWRYDKYKNQFPRIWQLVNFSGIHLMPTIIVYLAMIPAILLLTQNPASATIYTWLSFFICLFAAAIQLISDSQMHRFRRKHPGKVCNVGLWSISRHPNYLGEILMWWGVFGIFYSVAGQEYWWTATGALANTLLFVFISIPLMEKRQLKNKPGYISYRKKTGMLFPGI